MSRNNRFFFIIVLGVISWVLASMMGWTGSGKDKKKSAEKAVVQTAEVQADAVAKTVLKKTVCARTPVLKGTVLSVNELVVKEITKENVIKDAIDDISQAEGFLLTETIEPGDQISKSKLVDLSGILKMSFHVPDGMRAISLRVTASENIISGLVSQSDHVDVIAVFKNNKDVDVPLARTLIQNAVLLAVGEVFNPAEKELSTGDSGKASVKQKTGSKSSGKTAAPAKTPAADAGNQAKKPEEPQLYEAKKVAMVTLAVAPEDAEKIALFTEKAEFYLTLRYPFDESRISSKGTTQSQVLGFMKRDEIISGKEDRIKLKGLEEQEKAVVLFRGIEKTVVTPNLKSAQSQSVGD